MISVLILKLRDLTSSQVDRIGLSLVLPSPLSDSSENSVIASYHNNIST